MIEFVVAVVWLVAGVAALFTLRNRQYVMGLPSGATPRQVQRRLYAVLVFGVLAALAGLGRLYYLLTSTTQ